MLDCLQQDLPAMEDEFSGSDSTTQEVETSSSTSPMEITPDMLHVGQMIASAATRPAELLQVGHMVGGRPDCLLQVGEVTGSRLGEFFPVVIANPAHGAPAITQPSDYSGTLATNGNLEGATAPEAAAAGVAPARRQPRSTPAAAEVHLPPPPWAAAAAGMVGPGGWTDLPAASSANRLAAGSSRGAAPAPQDLKQRQSRWQVTPEEQAKLDTAYHTTPFPSAEEQASLAAQLQVSHRRVQVWFQNKRQKERKMSKPPSGTKMGCLAWSPEPQPPALESAWSAEPPPAD